MAGLSKKHLLFVIFLILAGAFLRLYAPLQYPYAINQDELNNIYDGWSLAETGEDRWQTPNSFIVRGLGDEDNRPALQAWIIGGVFKITGYSIAVGRSVNAVIALLSLWLLFLFLRNSFTTQIALAGLALAVLSPWHVLFSRMAHEGAILPSFFIVLILYVWQKLRVNNYKNYWQLFLLAIIVGLSTSAYQATKLTALLMCITIAVDALIVSKNKFFPLLIIGVGCFVGAFPQLYTLFINGEAFFARARSQTIPLDSTNSVWKIITNFALNFEPKYLFFSSGTHNNLSTYRLYPAEVAIFYIGLLLLIINYKKIASRFPLYFIVVASIATVLPAAFTYANPNALRASGFVLLAPIITAFGWSFFIGLIKKETYKNVATVLGFVILFVSCAYTTINFRNNAEYRHRNQQHYLVSAYQKLDFYKDKYPKILIENTTGESYLYLISFCKIAPAQFQQMEKEYSSYGFDDFSRLDKYHFVKKETMDTMVFVPGALVAASYKLPGLQITDSSDFNSPRFYFQLAPTPIQTPSN